jgi:hydrogenase-4 component E
MSVFIFSILVMTYFAVMSKRTTTLVNIFSFQSFFLALMTLYAAYTAPRGGAELYVVAALLFAVKVIFIPYFLRRMSERIKSSENIGMLINPLLSLVCAVVLTYLAYLFANNIMYLQDSAQAGSLAVSLSVTLIGLFLMIFRLKALTQVIGLLVMENGIFLAAVSLCGNMPFLVELTIFFDVLICVIIFEIFIYKINRLFTHIDVDKLTELRG